MSSTSTKRLRHGPNFFDAETRVVDIDAHLTSIKNTYSDDFSGFATALAPDPLHPAVTDDDDVRTRLAKGSNPPMSFDEAMAIDAAMTTPMPASVDELLPPPPPPIPAVPMSRIEPTQVRLLNPDNQDSGPTKIHVARTARDTLPPLANHPPIAPQLVDPTEIKVLEAAPRLPVDDTPELTELRPHTQPSGPYCPVGAPQLAAYQIVRKLAVGGMGIVYDAYHRSSGQRVAVKYMRRAAAEKPELVQRFLAEAVAASRIDHPGVASIYDYGHDDQGVPYLVMEYLEGECLAERLSRGPVSPYELMEISQQIALILHAAHRCGIVHRDLKPDNIFLLAGSSPRVKVLDFGVAKFQNDDLFMRATKTGQMLGTPYYMSPEQCSGGAIDHRSDVYALGCVMYQMLTGRVPFSGNLIAVVTGHRKEKPTPIEALNPTIPASVVRLVERMLAKTPDKRPQDMGTVVDLLEAIAVSPPEPPRQPSSPSLPTPMSGSRPKLNMVDTIDSLIPNITGGDPAPVQRPRRRRVRIGFPLALILAGAAAVSIWLSFVV